MKPFERLRGWVSSSDRDKVSMDRRAFLKGMTVTAGGLLVPGAAVFDMGSVSKPFVVSPFACSTAVVLGSRLVFPWPGFI